MRFTRKPCMTALMVLALLIVGMGRRDAQAMAWNIDGLPRQNSQGGPTPSSGEPDVGSTRVQRTVILTSSPRSAPVSDQRVKVRNNPEIRWFGWIWVNRFMGMGR